MKTKTNLKTGCTGAVRNANRACKLDEVTDGDLRVRLYERRLRIHDVVNAAVCVEVRLGGCEDDHGSISTAAVGNVSCE